MNWIMATQDVFNEYGVTITKERQMSNGEYIKHFELSSTMMVTSHLDNRVTMFTEEAIREYVRFVEGDGQEV